MGRSEQVDYPIWSKPATPEVETTAGFDTIKDRFKALKPERLTSAASAYQEAASELARLTNDLQKHAQALIDAWEGDAAQKALDRLGQLHWTANKLSEDSIKTARTLHWYGNDIMQWYKDLGDKMSDGMIHTGGDDDQARRLMNRLNQRTATAHNSFPQKVTKDLPQSGVGDLGNPPGGPGGGPSGLGGGPSGLGGNPGGMGGGSQLPKTDPFKNNPNGPHLPSDNNSHVPVGNNLPIDHSKLPGGSGGGGGGSQLAGLHPPGGGGLGGGGLGGGLGGGTGGLGGDPFGAGNGLGGAPGTGPGSLASGGPGAGVGPGNGTPGAAGRGGMMPPMYPPGAGHGQGGKERERTTSLIEEEDVWGADEPTAPSMIDHRWLSA
jgi:uncharacterized protein YukE